MGRTLLAVLGTVTWFALIVAAFGFLSLLLDLDVVPEADAGPTFGSVLITLAGLVLFGLQRRWLRRRPSRSSAFVFAAIAVYAVQLVAGAIGYTLITADLDELVAYPIRHAISPFALAAALLAGAVAAAVLALRSTGGDPGGGTGGGGSGGRWPWENREES